MGGRSSWSPQTIVAIGIIGLFAWLSITAALLLNIRRVFHVRTMASGEIIPEKNPQRGIFLVAALYLTAIQFIYVPGPAITALLFLSFGILVAQEFHSGVTREWVLKLTWDSWQGSLRSAGISIVAIIVALGIKAVGSLLMGALVIIPAIASKNFTTSMNRYTLLSSIFGLTSLLAGLFLSVYLKLPSGPLVILTSVVFFLVSLLKSHE